MKYLKNNLSINLIKIGFIKWQVYKHATIVKIVSTFLFLYLQFTLWISIYSTNQVGQYELKQMLSYIFIGQILFNLYPSSVSSQLGYMINTGDIGLMLLKPISLMKQLFFENIGSGIYFLVTTVLPVTVFGVLVSGFDIRIEMLGGFLLVTAFSYVFIYLFELIIGILSFYTTSQWGIQSFKYAIITLLSGRFIPLSLYPEWAKRILDVLPFQIMYYTPSNLLINGSMEQLLGIVAYQIIVIALAYCLFKLLYMYAVKRLVIQGG